jgi:hypothetical protein
MGTPGDFDGIRIRAMRASSTLVAAARHEESGDV